MTDRRHDFHSRSRVVDLEQRYKRVARQLTLGFAALTLGMVLALLVVWSVAIDNRDQGRDLKHVVTQQRANRLANTVDGCVARNREHQVLRTILDRGATEARKLKSEGVLNDAQLRRNLQETERAKRSFPIERDCNAYAKRIIK